MNYTHYTRFGVSQPPAVADTDGFIPYRENFSLFPEPEWTDGERWIVEQSKRINEWREDDSPKDVNV